MTALEWLASLGVNGFVAGRTAIALAALARPEDAAAISAHVEAIRSGALPPNALTMDAILNCMGDPGILRLRDAELVVPDRPTLKVLVEELLVRQEYHFTSGCPDPLVIDGGANFGMAIYIVKSLYPDARIIALEPNPRMCDLIRENITRNGWRDVTLHEAALAGEAGRAQLRMSGTDVMASTLTGRLGAAESAVIEVATLPLARFIEGPVAFLKLDVEGVEEEVLRAAADRLMQVEQLFCEVHLDPDTPRGRLPAILEILDGAGMDVHVSRSPWVDRKFDRRGFEAVGQRYSLSLFARNRRH